VPLLTPPNEGDVCFCFYHPNREHSGTRLYNVWPIRILAQFSTPWVRPSPVIHLAFLAQLGGDPISMDLWEEGKVVR